MVGILLALLPIPCYRFERRPASPQRNFVLVERSGKSCRVFDGNRVHLYFIPRNEKKLFIALSAFGPFAFLMEIITRTVGRTLHDNQRIGQQRHRPAYRTYQRLGRTLPRPRPKSHLGKMCHDGIGTPNRLGRLGRRYGNTASRPLDDRCISGSFIGAETRRHAVGHKP